MPSSCTHRLASECADTVVDGERGFRRPRPIQEQLHGFMPTQGFQVGQLRGVWQFQRRHPKNRFTRDGQRLAAGGQDMQVFGPAEQHLGELSSGSDQMLAVVQHQQQMPVCEIVREGRLRSNGCHRLTDAKGCSNTLRNQIWVGERCQFDEPHAVGVGRQRIGGDLQGEPCLADPARPRQRDDTSVGPEIANVRHLASSTHESRQLLWQVVHQLVTDAARMRASLRCLAAVSRAPLRSALDARLASRDSGR